MQITLKTPIYFKQSSFSFFIWGQKKFENAEWLYTRGGGKSHIFKSQASFKSQYKQIKQVKSSRDKGQVKAQYQTTGTNISLPHDHINFDSEMNFNYTLKIIMF